MKTKNFKLYRRRLEMGYTQVQIANMINISQNSYSRIETKESKSVDVEIAMLLANYLKSTVEELFN